MKYSYSIIVLPFLCSLAAAQSDLFPECAKPCLVAAITDSTDCALNDIRCQCLQVNKIAIQTSATSCVLSSCADKALEVLTGTNELCKNVSPEAPSLTSAAPVPASKSSTTPESIDTTTVRLSLDQSVKPPSSTTSSSAVEPTTLSKTTSNNTPEPTFSKTSSTIPSPSQTLPSQPQASSGLSTGAKAGIGIGASLGAIAIAGAIFLAFMYGKKSSAAKTDRKENPGDIERKAELDSGGGMVSGRGYAEREKVELGDTGLLEAEGNNRRFLNEEHRRRGPGMSREGPVELG